MKLARDKSTNFAWTYKKTRTNRINEFPTTPSVRNYHIRNIDAGDLELGYQAPKPSLVFAIHSNRAPSSSDEIDRDGRTKTTTLWKM